MRAINADDERGADNLGTKTTASKSPVSLKPIGSVAGDHTGNNCAVRGLDRLRQRLDAAGQIVRTRCLRGRLQGSKAGQECKKGEELTRHFSAR